MDSDQSSPAQASSQPDFGAVAPSATPPWQIKLMRTLARATPYRIPAVRRRVIRGWRAALRARRRRSEARGSDAHSRPALYEMDAALERYLDFDGGFFVEAGANDGYEQSNTYRLERTRGWRGILVEPVPELHREAVLERPRSRVVNCALVASEHGAGEVAMRYGGLMSTVRGTHGSPADDSAFVAPAFALGLENEYEFSVTARTLSSLLDECGVAGVDFLSLDVEGYEAEVLRGLDLDRQAPRFMLIEMHDMTVGRAAIEEIVGERYRAVEQLSPVDMLYARRDQPLPVPSSRS